MHAVFLSWNITAAIIARHAVHTCRHRLSPVLFLYDTCIKQGNCDVLQKLIDIQAPPSFYSIRQEDPLLLAVRLKKVEMVDKLLGEQQRQIALHTVRLDARRRTIENVATKALLFFVTYNTRHFDEVEIQNLDAQMLDVLLSYGGSLDMYCDCDRFPYYRNCACNFLGVGSKRSAWQILVSNIESNYKRVQHILDHHAPRLKHSKIEWALANIVSTSSPTVLNIWQQLSFINQSFENTHYHCADNSLKHIRKRNNFLNYCISRLFF